jgi:hypothetical protein
MFTYVMTAIQQNDIWFTNAVKRGNIQSVHQLTNQDIPYLEVVSETSAVDWTEYSDQITAIFLRHVLVDLTRDSQLSLE